MLTTIEMVLTTATGILAATVPILMAKNRDQKAILEVTREEVIRANQEMERQSEVIRQRRTALEEEDQRRTNLLRAEEQRTLTAETKLEHSQRRVKFLEGVERDLREKLRTAVNNLEAAMQENLEAERRVKPLEELAAMQDRMLQERDREVKELQARLGEYTLRLSEGHPDTEARNNWMSHALSLWRFMSPQTKARMRTVEKMKPLCELMALADQASTSSSSAGPSDPTPPKD